MADRWSPPLIWTAAGRYAAVTCLLYASARSYRWGMQVTLGTRRHEITVYLTARPHLALQVPGRVFVGALFHFLHLGMTWLRLDETGRPITKGRA